MTFKERLNSLPLSRRQKYDIADDIANSVAPAVMVLKTSDMDPRVALNSLQQFLDELVLILQENK